MGKASKRKGRKDQPAVSAPPGVPPDIAARLARGLSPEELGDPAIMNQIMRGVQHLPSGVVHSFTEGHAPSAVPSAELPALTDADLDPVPEGGVLPIRPSQVIDLQADLAGRLARRDAQLVRYFDGFMDDALGRGLGDDDIYDKWGVMFQPARDGAEYCGVLARQLTQARTYQVTGRMVDVIDTIYTRTADQAHEFQIEDVPWPSGFAYLDKPLSLIDRQGKVVKNRVLSWNLESARFKDEPGSPARPAVRIACWSWWADEDAYWTPEIGGIIRRQGGLSLAHSIIVPFNYEYRSLVAREADGIQYGDVSRWLHALWLMMESEVPAMRRASDIERHTARRAMRSLNHADVTVVTLRRTASKGLDEGEPGHRVVDWTHRWVVQGFWRHHHKQDHHAAPDQSRESCLVCGIRISWVRPHLRGPSDLPLQQKPQLYRLSR